MREIYLQGASDDLTASGRQALSDQIQYIIDDTMDIETSDDGTALDKKNVEQPKVEDAIEDTGEDNTKNSDADGSEETKA